MTCCFCTCWVCCCASEDDGFGDDDLPGVGLPSITWEEVRCSHLVKSSLVGGLSTGNEERRASEAYNKAKTAPAKALKKADLNLKKVQEATSWTRPTAMSFDHGGGMSAVYYDPQHPFRIDPPRMPAYSPDKAAIDKGWELPSGSTFYWRFIAVCDLFAGTMFCIAGKPLVGALLLIGFLGAVFHRVFRLDAKSDPSNLVIWRRKPTAQEVKAKVTTKAIETKQESLLPPEWNERIPIYMVVGTPWDIVVLVTADHSEAKVWSEAFNGRIEKTERMVATC